MSRYDPAVIEPSWQAWWDEHRTFEVAMDTSKPKFYALGMFPYPSGSGLHVGHPESYTALDIVARYKRMKGFCVLHPMGWDAFGLQTERAAVREGRHPADIAGENIARFKVQLKRLGYSYDWDREISTTDPDYYRHTQWIFQKLHEMGLAYLAEVPVNWCPAQGTVLANEEVVDGRYVETGDPVERRSMKQWMLKITAYAQRLLDDLEGLDWPAGVLEMQRNWIGRSEGAEVTFRIQSPDAGADADAGFTVFTTRPDTLFGATYAVLAPEHPLVAQVTTDAQRAAVDAYVTAARNRSDMDRQLAAEKEKTGVFSGGYAINPVNGQPIPIWIADYVLMTYGTGAIMAVPGQDERDWAFAEAFDIPIIRTVEPPEGWAGGAYTGDGPAINSGFLDGMRVAEAKAAMIDWLEAQGLGERKVNFKLRDWLFSRQRYWGEPFPVLHGAGDDNAGAIRMVDAADLPVTLPFIEAYKPTADGRPPLARAGDDWSHVTLDGQTWIRETNTMPQWAGSCWYYLRYMDPHNEDTPVSPEAERYWGPVDLYIGGVEHAVLHLLYARFWHKVLYDCGLVHTAEPFKKLFNQGMILAHSYRSSRGKYYYPHQCERRPGEAVTITSASSGDPVETEWYVANDSTPVERSIEKMGKSKLNVVDPLDVVKDCGADALRMYLMAMGPLEKAVPWEQDQINGILRFLNRVWRLVVDERSGELNPKLTDGAADGALGRALHVAIKDVGEGIEALRFNTPIARMTEFVNAATAAKALPRSAVESFLVVLSPYAPHLAEELWRRLGHSDTIVDEPWPAYDPAALVSKTVTVVVQIKGKRRGQIEVAADASREAILGAARAVPNVARHLEGMQIIKEIVVPGRLVNFVVRPAR